MRTEIHVQWWDDGEVNHLADSFWINDAMKAAVGQFWYNHIRLSDLPMPNVTLSLDTERGVVVCEGTSSD